MQVSHAEDISIDKMDISSIDTKARTLQFKLSDKNLIRAASRIPVECDPKQFCTMLKFSACAYIQAVKPTILFWKSQSGKYFQFENLNIKVDAFEERSDGNNKHYDSKTVFLTDNPNHRIVVHSYNSTQNLKVEGSGYAQFIQNYLAPFAQDTINGIGLAIEAYNKAVINAFTVNKPIKAKSCRSVKGLKQLPNFSCKRCEYSSRNIASLKKHKIAKHTNIDDSQDLSCLSVKHSTRNNSFAEDEKLLCEDISLTAIIDKAHEVDAERSEIILFACKFCNTKFEADDALKNHTETEHQVNESLKENSRILPACETCKETFETLDDLENHRGSEHKAKEQATDNLRMKFTCETCTKSFEIQDSLKNHIENEHDTSETITVKPTTMLACETCRETYETQDELKNHAESEHKVVKSTIEKPKTLFACESCSQTFDIENDLKSHSENKHAAQGKRDRTELTCECCSKMFGIEEKLINHKRTEHKIEETPKEYLNGSTLSEEGKAVELTCRHCGYDANHAVDLQRHLAEKHTQRSFECTLCDYTGDNESDVNKHMKKNT